MRWGWGLRLARVLWLEFGLLLQWCWFGRLVVRSVCQSPALWIGRSVGRSACRPAGLKSGCATSKSVNWICAHPSQRARHFRIGMAKRPTPWV